MSFKRLAASCAVVVILLTAVPLQAFAMDDGSMYAVVNGSPVDMWGDTLLFTMPVKTASGTRTDLYAESLGRGTRECLGPVVPDQAAIDGNWVVLAKPVVAGATIILRNLVTGEIRQLGHGSDPAISGDSVVFAARRPGLTDGSDVLCYSIGSFKTTIVAGTFLDEGTGLSVDQILPEIDGDLLTFVSVGENQGLYTKGLYARSASVVTTEAKTDAPIVARSGWSAWLGTEIVSTMDGDVEVAQGRYRKLPDGTAALLESEAGSPSDLTAWRDTACWQLGLQRTDAEGRAYEYASYIQVRALPTPAEAGPQTFGAVTGDGFARNPAICGGAVAWRQLPASGDANAARLQIGSLLYNISLTPSTTSPRARGAVTLGGRVNTKARTAAGGIPVAIEKWTGSRWSGVAVGTTSSYGRFVCTVHPTAKTTYRLRYMAKGSEPSVFSEKVTIYPR